jgi:hypothetical protein
VRPDAAHNYSFSGTATGIPAGYEGGATFTIESTDSRARFVPTDGCTITNDGLTLTCDAVTNGAVPFKVYVKDNSVDTPVTITLAPLAGLEDPGPAVNSASTVLKALRPAVDVKLALTTEVVGNAGRGTATAVITGAPAEGATLTADFEPVGVRITQLPAACTLGDKVATCRAVANGTSLLFEVELTDRPSNFTTETVTFRASAPDGYDDTEPANNTATLVVPRDKGGAHTTPTSLLRTTASDLTGQGAGPTASPSVMLPQVTPEATLLSGARTQPAQPAAPATPAAKKPAKPGKTDKGSAKPGKVDAPGQAGTPQPAGADPGSGNGQGNDRGNGQGNGKKDEPSPVEQVVDALISLLP